MSSENRKLRQNSFYRENPGASSRLCHDVYPASNLTHFFSKHGRSYRISTLFSRVWREHSVPSKWAGAQQFSWVSFSSPRPENLRKDDTFVPREGCAWAPGKKEGGGLGPVRAGLFAWASDVLSNTLGTTSFSPPQYFRHRDRFLGDLRGP